MFLEQRINFFNPDRFNLATNTILGTTQRWSIDRTWPIEEILIFVNFDVTTGLTIGATPLSTDAHDNILQILQHVNLSVNDGRQPRSVVDCNGIALLEYGSQAGFNLDVATLTAIQQAQFALTTNGGATLGVPVGVYQMCYRIPCVSPKIAEPLRTRMYVPAHTYPQDPVLTLQFNTLTGMGATAGAIGTIRVEVVLLRRVPTAQSEKLLRSTPGSNPTGYIDWDLIETPFAVPLNNGTEQRFSLPVPGNYLDLLFRQYKGGASYTRTACVDTDLGDTIANNLGLETRWRLDTGGVTVREWRWKHLRTMNDFSRPQVPMGPLLTLKPTLPLATGGAFVGLASAGAVTIGLSNQPTNFPSFVQGAAGTANYRAGSSTYLDFLTDGINGGSGNELGSLLDCNTPANNGLKMELIGTPASVATNASLIFVTGRRLFGDISRWQKF
jgi:hypothetical protein